MARGHHVLEENARRILNARLPCPAHPEKHRLENTLPAHQRKAQRQTNNGNGLMGLARPLRHKDLNTTARYTERSHNQLPEATERLTD